jgi:AraC family transcriptional activator of pobA
MKPVRGKVPVFSLYGEQRPEAAGQRLHIEDIQSRSRRYRWEIAAHTHRGLHQCVFVLQGPADVQLDGTQHVLLAPAVVLLPPATVHAFHFTPETRGHVLTLASDLLLAEAPSFADASLDRLAEAPHILPLDGDGELPQRLRTLLELLSTEFCRPDAASSPVCLWLARSALWIVGNELLRRHLAPVGSLRQHRALAQFRVLLERHYAEHWPVQRYARQLGLTATRLNRIARAQTGRSAFALVQERVLLEARRRLTYVAMPVAQVARELGFRDPAYFSRFVKRHAGLPPRTFRQQGGI